LVNVTGINVGSKEIDFAVSAVIKDVSLNLIPLTRLLILELLLELL